MSTSPRRAPADAAGEPCGSALVPRPFSYEVVSPNTVASGDDIALAKDGRAMDPAAAAASAREAQALAQARLQGQAEARRQFDEQLAKERMNLARALKQFSDDRARYFQQVEGEVVQLALATARRILHRESQLDPLLLAAAVRVALEKIGDATRVVLRVHPQNALEWRHYLAAQFEPAALPEIVEDPAQPPDSCSLETAMGKTSIGVETQLKEIEQGFFDLLAARPGGSP